MWSPFYIRLVKICVINGQKMNKEKRKPELPEDDWVVYLPNAAMRSFESAYFKMWQALKGFQKYADEMKHNRNNDKEK